MLLGIDASTQIELDEAHPHYYYQGEEIEPWSFLHEHNGATLMRLRLWVDPHDEEGRPFGGGTNDFHTFIALAKRAIKHGYQVLLDFHYSDFWADPSKQNMPKAWRGLDFEQLKAKVHDYTVEVLKAVRKEGIPLAAVQCGNEITNGILWPFGQLSGGENGKIRDGYDNLAALLQSGCLGVREVYPEAKVVLHLEKSGAVATHDEWYGQMVAHGVDFDICGLSYYPYWHGNLAQLKENIINLTRKYHKPIWVVEAGYPFTAVPYGENIDLTKFLGKSEYLSYTGEPLPYPLTQQGQADYFTYLLGLLRELKVEALFYWEPFWIPSTGVGWAKAPGMRYEGAEVSDEHYNEWANQCLFDYEGKANPVIDVFKI